MPDKKKTPGDESIDGKTPPPVGDEPQKKDVPPVGDEEPIEKDKRFS